MLQPRMRKGGGGSRAPLPRRDIGRPTGAKRSTEVPKSNQPRPAQGDGRSNEEAEKR